MKYTAQELYERGEITLSQKISIELNAPVTNDTRIELLGNDVEAHSAYAQVMAYTGKFTRDDIVKYITRNTHYNAGSALIGYTMFTNFVMPTKTHKRGFKAKELYYLRKYAIQLGVEQEFIDGVHRYLAYELNGRWLSKGRKYNDILEYIS